MPGVTFCPIASGSDGNSIYIGHDDTHILIDAGISCKRICAGLATIGVDPAALAAVFITHEHSDHIQGAAVLSRKYGVPVYASAKTWRYLERHTALSGIAPENKQVLPERYVSVTVNEVSIRAFDIPHDAAEPVGYAVHAGSLKISVATDLGHMTDTIRENISDSHIVLLESNHDLEMLQNGRYPAALKKRVMGERGHLSNVAAGHTLTEIMSQKLQYAFLGHLSAENNLPLLAMDTVCRILETNGIRVGTELNLLMAHRGAVSQKVCVSE